MLIAVYGLLITRLEMVERRTLEGGILQIRLRRSGSIESVFNVHVSYDTNRQPAKD